MRKRLILAFIAVMTLFMMSVSQSSAADTVNDTSNDVWKIIYAASALYSNADQGNYHDEIDIASISLAVDGTDNKSLQLVLSSTPVIDDGNHGYWVSASVVDPSSITFTIVAWAGSTGSGTEESYFTILNDDPENMVFESAANIAVIAGSSLKWSYNASVWPQNADLSTWDLTVWTYYASDGWQQSRTSGEAYWDYFPNEEAAFSEGTGSSPDSSSSSDGTGDTNGLSTPGFSLVESAFVLAITAAAVTVMRRRR
ncbi:MAG: hypothetical protein ACFFD4_13185 [Candidatus Odinarchaeota archaeon]